MDDLKFAQMLLSTFDRGISWMHNILLLSKLVDLNLNLIPIIWLRYSKGCMCGSVTNAVVFSQLEKESREGIFLPHQPISHMSTLQLWQPKLAWGKGVNHQADRPRWFLARKLQWLFWGCEGSGSMIRHSTCRGCEVFGLTRYRTRRLFFPGEALPPRKAAWGREGEHDGCGCCTWAMRVHSIVASLAMHTPTEHRHGGGSNTNLKFIWSGSQFFHIERCWLWISSCLPWSCFVDEFCVLFHRPVKHVIFCIKFTDHSHGYIHRWTLKSVAIWFLHCKNLFYFETTACCFWQWNPDLFWLLSDTVFENPTLL